MARPSGVWWRERDGWWMSTVKGEQIKVLKGGTKTEARNELIKLLAAMPTVPKGTKARPSFAFVADQFLEHSQKTNAEDTYNNHKRFLQDDVYDWLDSHKPWGKSSRAYAISILLACLNWATKREKITLNPLAKLKREYCKSRTRILTKEEKDAIRSHIKDVSFANYIYVLENTGARPFSELIHVCADDLDITKGTITLKKHKNSKTNKRRTLYCTPALLALLSMLATLHPKGPLLRNTRGGNWTRNTIIFRFKGLREKLNIKGLTSYCYRHTYITEALARGLTSNIVAELVGNSPRTIEKYYDHLDQKLDTMKEAARKAVE